MRRLVLTTDWSTIKRRKREKKILIGSGFFLWKEFPQKESDDGILYINIASIEQFCNRIRSFHTWIHATSLIIIEEEVEKIVFGRLPLFFYPIPSSSSVYMMSYRRRWWVYVYFTLEPLAASVVVVLGHDLYTCIYIRALAVAWSCLDRRFFFCSLSPSSSTSLFFKLSS